MRKALTYVAAGALALSAAGAVPTFGAEPNRGEARRELAEARFEAKEEAAIRNTIAKAVDRGLSEKGMTEILSAVDHADRERIEKHLQKADETAYKQAAEKFQNAWKLNHRHPFDAQKHMEFLNEAKITSEQQGQRALVSLPGARDVKPFVLHLQRDKLNEWRIDPSDRLTGQELERDMLRAIRDLNERGGKTVSEVNHAYKQAAAEILRPLAYTD